MGNKKVKKAEDYKCLKSDRLHRRIDTKDLLTRINNGLEESEIWTKPRSEFPIDNQIEILIHPEKRNLDPRNRKKPPMMRGRKDLSSREILCPYEYARNCIVRAVEFANNKMKDTLEGRTNKADALSAFKEEIKKANYHNNRVIALLEGGILRNPIRNGIEEKIGDEGYVIDTSFTMSCARNTSNTISRHNNLNTIADDLKKHYRPGNPGIFWERQFTASIGFSWRKLTGTNPTYNDANPYFEDFVKSAYETIYKIYGEAHYNLSWKSIIEGACKEVINHTGWEACDPNPAVVTDITKHFIFGFSNSGDYFWIERNRRLNDKFMKYAISFAEAKTEKEYIDAMMGLATNFSVLVNEEKGRRAVADALRLGYAIDPYKLPSPLTRRRMLEPRVEGLRYLPAPQPYVSSARSVSA